ncbi:MAG: hypothetical protein L0K65_05800 [Actinomyces sp.]|nr:hypothetical protein [Propionibacterium sp.]MDN6566550.1 hypothetical protein [Actinomyces sp.]
MAAAHTVPDHLSHFLPRSDRRATAEELGDGRWLVAGRHAVVVVGEEGVVDSGMWYEVQHVRWDSASRDLTLTWVDPGRPPLVVRMLTTDPAAFMGEVTGKVTHSLVVQKSAVVGGTTVTAAVRRRDDGALFSTLVADGPLDEGGRQLADALESEVRDGVGLD